jgi:hypothetical protein
MTFALAAQWALKNWKLVAGGLAIAVLGIMLLIARGDARHWKKAAAAEKQAHALTVANYRQAAEIARRKDAENVNRVRSEQQAITERIEDEYQGKLATADARYERLRTTARTYTGSAGTADVSASREATCLAYAGTGCENIPPLLKAAQDNTDQLIALIAWTKAQGEVNTNEGGD